MNISVSHPQAFLHYAAAMGFGALLPLGFAPFHFYPLTFLALLGVLLLWQSETRHQALLSGWFFGIGLYAVGASWVFVSIHDYSATPLPVAILLTVLFILIMGFVTAVQGYLYRVLGLNRWALLGFPALWVLVEWVKTWLFTGFPWLYVGYALSDTPVTGFAPISGIFGLSALLCIGVTLLYLLLKQLTHPSPRKKLIIYTVLVYFIAVPVIGLKLQALHWTQVKNPKPLTVSIIQGNIPQEIKWDLNFREAILNLYRERTEANPHSDLIIWPEAAVPAFEHEVRDYLVDLDRKTRARNTTLIVGLAHMETPAQGEWLFYNSIRALGAGYGLYHKQRLVPFGEFIPFEQQLRGITEFFDLPMSSFTRGNSDQHPLFAGSYTIAPSICYEILFPDLTAQVSRNTDVLLTISNDGWFGRSIGPAQHFEMARMRAIETGRYLIRGTNNGISAIVDPQGHITHIAPSFVETTLHGEVLAMQGNTPFMNWGSRPVLTGAGLIVIGLSLATLRQNRLSRRTLLNTAV